MGYVVAAKEVIPTLKPTQTYSAILLPQWPHLYTWLLQAAGYLVLESKKKKLIIISEQNYDLKNILIDTNTYWPIFGKKRKQSQKNRDHIQQHLKAKLSKKNHKDIIKSSNAQLPFIRMILEVEEYIHIAMGAQLSEDKKKALLMWIKKNISDYNIVLLTNIELLETKKKSIVKEEKEMAEIITNPKKVSSSLVEIFKGIHKITQQETKIIAYINPKDFWSNWSPTERYVCAVT